MSSVLLSSADAARKLGISVLTLYGWLDQSDAGEFEPRGQPVSIEYYQGGRLGQGRIKITSKDVDRLLELMRVTPNPRQTRRPPTVKSGLQHITSRLGRPED